MAQMSNYLQDKLIDHVFRNTPYVQSSQLYVALYADDPTDADVGTELTGSGYTRIEIDFDAPVVGTGTTQNTADVTFPTATSDWTTVTHIGIRDASSAGNLITFQALTGSVTILSSNNFRIPAGKFTAVMS